MARNEVQEPRNRSNSLSAAWSYLWRGSKQPHPNQLDHQHHPQGSPSGRSTKHSTIREEEGDEDAEDRALGKGITRKVLPQQRRSTSSAQSSPAGSSRTSPKIEFSKSTTTTEAQPLPQQQHQPSALERIAIHNGNINNALASTMHHSLSLPPMNRVHLDRQDTIFEGVLAVSTEDSRPHYHAQLQQQQQLKSRQRAGHGRHLSVPEGVYGHEGRTTTTSTSTARSDGQHKMLSSSSKDGCGSESADSTAHSTTTGAHRSSSPASCCSASSSSCPSPPSDKDNIPGTSSRPTAAFKSSRGLSSSSSSSSPPPSVGLGLIGVHTPQETSDLLSQFNPPVSGPSYFDITPSSASLANGSPAPSNSKKSSAFATKTPGRRSKRTPAHSISSTITNGGHPSSRRVSCADTASQNSASYIDEQDVEVDENSFYIHLQKMQDRYHAQQEPGWLRTQHALLQAKHRIPGSGSPQSDHRSAFGGRKTGGLVPGSQPFLSRIHSSGSSPNSSDYSSSPSFHLGPHHSRQPYSGTSSSQRHQPIQPFNCFQPGNVICVPRERTLGGLVFHKSFVDTHILTPSPYYRGQYLTLDNKVVEIDKDFVREISGFSHPRSVQILSEETVYNNNSSKKPTRVLVLERPLEGDGVALTKSFDGPTMPSMRQFSSDMEFLEAFPELNRALRDFRNLCHEFDNTYVYIRGFAAYTLEKLRLIYEKVYRDCVGDSVKLQRLLDRGIQAEQECFAELMENIVLGRLYQKLFVHSLMPCYAERDVEIDEIVAKYHHHLFAPGAHRGIDGGGCLAANESPMLQDALQKLGLSEKWRTMRFDAALDGAAGLFRAWDHEGQEDESMAFSSSQSASAMASRVQESEQEKKRRQLRESLRVFVQDDKYKSSSSSDKRAVSLARDETEMDDGEEEDPTTDAVWNTPLEKASSIKLVLDIIAAVAEEHLMNGQSFGFVHKKRSEVSVTTDDFIPLLAIVIIQARMMRLGSNMFYVQRFRINTPKSDINFALVTFEASVEFLKTDPLGLLGTEQTPPASSATLSSLSRTSFQGSQPRIEIEQRSPAEESQVLPWGTPSHTGWGFSPPKTSSDALSFDLLTSISEKNILPTTPSVESSPVRPPLSSRVSSDYFQQQQQRHARSASMNFDDRLRRVTAHSEEGGSVSSNNSSWSKSPMLGPRFASGANSPLGATSPSYGVFSNSSEAAAAAGGGSGGPGALTRRPTNQQRHSISSGQAQMYTAHAQQNHGHLYRVSGEHGRDSMTRSTLFPHQSPSMTPQLVVKPQIMLPPPKTPPMSGQNTSGRARPMSMVVVGALASSAYSSSYGGPGATTTRKSFSSNHSSPATSPRLGPGTGSSRQSGARSNSLMSGPFPMLRANSMSTVLTATELTHGSIATADKSADQSEPLSPVSPISPWVSKTLAQPPQSPRLSASPSQMDGSPVLTEPAGGPLTPETVTKARSGSNAPGRIRTSPSSTMSSISTPTTPSTFSSASGSALLESLNTSAQLASPAAPAKSSATSSEAASLPPSSSTAPLSATGNVRSQSSLGRQSSIRLSLPRLSLSPSAPSTAFCRTTVTAAATHATTSVDDFEPTSTVLATDQYGTAMIATVTPATPATPSVSATVTSTSTAAMTVVHSGERNSISNDGRSSSGSAKVKETTSTHQKVDSGKYMGPLVSHHSHSYNGSNGSSSSSSSSSIAIVEHFSRGTALDFEQNLCLDPHVMATYNPIMSDRRRGSATSLRSTKSVGSFQPEKEILLWNQAPSGSVVENNHGNGGQARVGGVSAAMGGRLTVSSGDLPSASGSASSFSVYSHPRPYTSRFVAGTAGDMPRGGNETPLTGSFVTEDPQQRAKQMMGDFLSELAKVEDGDVLVGNGRNGVMSRQ